MVPSRVNFARRHLVDKLLRDRNSLSAYLDGVLGVLLEPRKDGGLDAARERVHLDVVLVHLQLHPVFEAYKWGKGVVPPLSNKMS